MELKTAVTLHMHNLVLNIDIRMQCNCNYVDIITFDKDTSNLVVDEDFAKFSLQTARDEVVGFLMKNDLKLSKISTKMYVEKENTSFNVEQTDCVWIVYDVTETRIQNDTVEIIATGKTFGLSVHLKF